MRTIKEILFNADNFDEAVKEWHLERGGSMSDTTNIISYSDSLDQVLKQHAENIKLQETNTVTNNTFDFLND